MRLIERADSKLIACTGLQIVCITIRLLCAVWCDRDQKAHWKLWAVTSQPSLPRQNNSKRNQHLLFDAVQFFKERLDYKCTCQRRYFLRNSARHATSLSILFSFKATVLMFQHDPIHYVLVTAVKVALLLWEPLLWLLLNEGGVATHPPELCPNTSHFLDHRHLLGGGTS